LHQPLECAAQQYAWGKIGSDALVARLKAAQLGDESSIQEEKPYAELWIGTHPNGMSQIVLPSIDESKPDDIVRMKLVDYVQQNPEMHLGVVGETEPSNEYDLTFLFKVLSIEKVLSVQAHPDKHLAAQLFTERPDVYKDPNHKPEMAVALTDDFEAMSGFRPIYDIASNLLDYPEFTDLIGKCRYDILQFVAGKRGVNPKPILKTMFHTYITADEIKVKNNLDKLNSRLAEKEDHTDLDKLIIKLAKQFPGDAGIFAPIIFNYLKLKTGDAFYIGANEPHAYIQGDILECMACSDNVVRAGLTPKLKDVATLVKMLTYKCTTPKVTRGERKDNCCTLYVPPVKDFAMEIVEVDPGESYELQDVRSPSVILTLNGSGVLKQGWVNTMPVSFGKAAFMSANTSATMVADKDGPGLKVVRALSNVHLNSV
jgi:mannose-6-phosphate isomerase